MKGKADTEIWNDPDAFAGTVRLGLSQAQAVSAEELPFVLAYELEPASGIPASQAEVSWKETEGGDPAMRVFEVRVRRRGGVSRARTGRPAAIAAVCCSVFAAVAIAVDAARIASSLSALEKDVAVRSRLTAELRGIESSAQSAQIEAQNIRTRREEAEASASKAALLRGSYSSAMGVVASVCVAGGKSFVRGFSSPEPFRLEIRAISESAQTASGTMSSLAKAVSAKGWTLLPGGIRQEGTMSVFSCTIDMGGAK